MIIEFSNAWKMKSVTATALLGLIVMVCFCLLASASPVQEDSLRIRECKLASEFMGLSLEHKSLQEISVAVVL